MKHDSSPKNDKTRVRTAGRVFSQASRSDCGADGVGVATPSMADTSLVAAAYGTHRGRFTPSARCGMGSAIQAVVRRN